MADPPASHLGTDNWKEWTYTDVVHALSGDNISLVADKPFLNWADKAAGAAAGSATQWFYYYAFGTQYFGVDFDQVAANEWLDKVEKVKTAVSYLASGVAGTFDLTTMQQLYEKLFQVQTVTGQLARDLGGWVKLTTGKDGPLAGKAVDVLRARLQGYAATLDAWAAQMYDNYGTVVWLTALDAYDKVQLLIKQLSTSMFDQRNILTPYSAAVQVYATAASALGQLPWSYVSLFFKQYYQHIVSFGLVVHESPYYLDDIVHWKIGSVTYSFDDGTTGVIDLNISDPMERVKTYIKQVLAITPIGVHGTRSDVTSAGTWQRLDREIHDGLKAAVATLDQIASAAVPPTAAAYRLLKRSLPNLDDPVTVPANANANLNLNLNLNSNLNLNGPPDLNLNLPNFNLNLPNFNLNLDQSGLGGPGPGGPNNPLNLGPATSIVPPGGGGPSALDITPNGLGDSFFKSGAPNGLDPSSGLGVNLGGSAGDGPVVPGLGPIGGGSVGPNGEILGPDGKPILGPNGEVLGPNGKPILGPNGEILGPDGKPILGPNGEILGPDGKPILGPGGEVLGPDGQPILGPDGQPILGPNGDLIPLPNEQPIVIPGVGPLPDGGPIPNYTASVVPSGPGIDANAALPVLSDGTFGLPSSTEAALSPQALASYLASHDLSGGPLNASGFPMYPPMGGMGGMGAGGGGRDREERERQTWLTEDEAVWGTSAGAVGSVIGRLEDAGEPDEELILLGPVRGSRPEPRSGAKPTTHHEQVRAQAGRDGETGAESG